MTILLAAMISIVFISVVMFTLNSLLFHRAPRQPDLSPTASDLPQVSVLIPARDEGLRLEATLRHVLSSEQVELEVIVLDDQSKDNTAEIVQALGRMDQRVKLISGRPLPAGWCGKQFACFQLAAAATFDEFVFLDADVHLQPSALARAVALRRRKKVDLLSGFPRQLTETWGEALLIPMIYLVLLTYLPFLLMRLTRMSTASAGCGQWFLTARGAYKAVGGHACVKSSLHDGVMLPRAYRDSGLMTDIFDASDLATCRMYSGWQETFLGLRKNATEGIANRRLIVPFSILLCLGYVFPLPTLALVLLSGGGEFLNTTIGLGFLTATVASWLPSLILVCRGLAPKLFALMFPIGVALFLAIQWQSLWYSQRGVRSVWRGRSYETEQFHG